MDHSLEFQLVVKSFLSNFVSKKNSLKIYLKIKKKFGTKNYKNNKKKIENRKLIEKISKLL